jgi:hypothetical protein
MEQDFIESFFGIITEKNPREHFQNYFLKYNMAKLYGSNWWNRSGKTAVAERFFREGIPAYIHRSKKAISRRHKRNSQHVTNYWYICFINPLGSSRN